MALLAEGAGHERASLRGPVRRRVASSEHFTGWAFVTPAVVIIGLFGAAPIVWSAVMSFQKNNLLTPDHAVRGHGQLPADDPRPDSGAGNPAHADLHRAIRAGDDGGGPVPGRGDEPEDPLHLVLPDRRLRHDGDLHDQRGDRLHLAVRPVLRGGQLLPRQGRRAAAAVHQLAVPGALRDRDHDDLGLDRLRGGDLPGRPAGGAAAPDRGGRDRRGRARGRRSAGSPSRCSARPRCSWRCG